MNVGDAVRARKSVRAFLDTPVPDDVLRDLLELAARAPSGGNLQPWRIYVVNGDAMPAFQAELADRDFDEPEYDMYPPGLQEPYRTNRFVLGEAMYQKLGIPREDKGARLAHMARNYLFFDAPCGLFCYVDRNMGSPQWSDLGMFLQTFMLLAQEAGLDTCAQESWALRHQTVTDFVGASENEMLFCGMAVGYADWNKPVNSLVSERMPLDDWCTWL